MYYVHDSKSIPWEWSVGCTANEGASEDVDARTFRGSVCIHTRGDLSLGAADPTRSVALAASCGGRSDAHDLVIAAELLGHARLETTRAYSQPTQQDAIAAALDDRGLPR